MRYFHGNSKAVLDVTTKINFRSAILPLTNIYQTDILSQKLIRLRIKFYTDTLFAYDTFVRGNTCAQLNADGYRFVHIFPMRSKAGAVDSLDNVVKYIGIMNEIHCDKELKQVGEK